MQEDKPPANSAQRYSSWEECLVKANVMILISCGPATCQQINLVIDHWNM